MWGVSCNGFSKQRLRDERNAKFTVRALQAVEVSVAAYMHQHFRYAKIVMVDLPIAAIQLQRQRVDQMPTFSELDHPNR